MNPVSIGLRRIKRPCSSASTTIAPSTPQQAATLTIDQAMVQPIHSIGQKNWPQIVLEFMYEDD